MLDFAILSEYGTTDDRLREFFSSKLPTPKQLEKMTPKEIRIKERDVKMRDKFQKMISGWLQEHIVFSLANHSKYAAVDLAWDAMPINHQVYPLIQYAQGRMDLGRVSKAMQDVPNGDKYLRKEGGEVVGIDLPKFTEVQINLLRSVITRRLAPQAVKYNGLYPFFKYEPRDQTQVGKLRADMVSQRMDIMADQFDYRHFQTQVIRDMFLYAKCVAFPRSYWERQIQLERETLAMEFDDKGKIKTKAKVVREGIAWEHPHPSRVFYDNNYPLTTLNTDTGCEYVGFWDVCRWGDISDNAAYFNRRNVSYTSGMCDWFSTYWAYFNQYFTTIVPPSFPQASGNNVVATNDRKNQVGLFTGQMESVSTIFTHLWVKMRPVNWGLGTYPHLVWVHLKVAGDATVVYAKICPSSPAAVFSYNENDGRLVNISLAHELMTFQDQLTNLFSQLLEIAKQDLFSVAVLNTDVFPDNEEGKKVRDEFKNLLRNKERYASTQLLEISFSKLQQLGIKPSEVFTVVRSHPNTALTNVFEAITTVIKMANTIMVLSDQEQGQQQSHEMSAHESVAIERTTNSVYDFISLAIDEGRSAMKRICFESLISCGTDDVELTVENRYPKSIIQKAGFNATNPDDAQGYTGYSRVTGNKMYLVHDYIFTSRDGGNRAGGPQGAQVLVQLLQAIGALQPEMQNAVLSAMGKTKVFELMNTIFRMTDAGVDLKLELKAGESDDLTLSQDAQFMQAVQKLAAQMADEVKATNSMHQAIQLMAQVFGQSNPQLLQQITALLQQGMPPQPPAEGTQAGPAAPPPAPGQSPGPPGP